jgi:uncharacterized membrane protein
MMDADPGKAALMPALSAIPAIGLATLKVLINPFLTLRFHVPFFRPLRAPFVDRLRLLFLLLLFVLGTFWLKLTVGCGQLNEIVPVVS